MMTDKKKFSRVRDIINHLQTLPQDMEFRIVVEHSMTEEVRYCEVENIEIHELDETVPNRPWNNKAVVIKIMD